MIKKLTLITILLLGNIAFSQELKLTDKYLFATLKGKIDGKYDITMNIQICDVYSLAGGMTVGLRGNYHYDRFGKNIYFTKGSINKNSMIIEAEGDEVFNFKLDEATLNKILELKTSSKKITINGTWEGNSKSFSCVINNISPLGGKLSEVYEYGISSYQEYNFRHYDDPSISCYILYSPYINVSSFDKAVVKIDSDTLKKIIKEKLSNIYDECFSEITYFDNKILCINDYRGIYYPHHNNGFYDYNIVSLETGKRLNNTLEDLVDYNDKFIEFIKKEFIEYNKEVSKIIIYYDDLDLPEQSRKSKFIFSDYGFFVDIYNEHFPDVARGSNLLGIEMKKLKPYIKKDSIYRYLFN